MYCILLFFLIPRSYVAVDACTKIKTGDPASTFFFIIEICFLVIFIHTTKVKFIKLYIYFQLNLKRYEVCVTILCACFQIWETTAKVLYIVGEDDQFVDPKFSKILYNLYPENERHKLIVKSYPNTGHLIEPCYTSFCSASYHNLFGLFHSFTECLLIFA